MNRIIPLLAFSVLLLVPIGSQNAFAGTPVFILVSNHSFENPSLLNLGDTTTSINDWTTNGSPLIQKLPFNPNGFQSLRLDSEEDEVSQSVGIVVPNTRYVLSGQVQIQLFAPFGLSLGEFGLRVGGIDQVITTGSVNPFSIIFSPFSATWESPASGPLIGQPLEIVLRHGSDEFQSSLIHVDSISLTAEDISPPTCEEACFDSHNSCQQLGNPDCDAELDACLQACVIPPENEVIGGEIIPIESTSLLLAEAQSFSWMIPVMLSVLGIGLFVVSRKSEN